MTTADLDVSRSTAPTMRPVPPKRTALWTSALLTLAVALWSIIGLDILWTRLFRAPERLFASFRAMARLFEWDVVPTALEEMWESVSMAWLGTILAALVAVPFGLAAAENVVPPWFSLAMRQVFNTLRSVPDLVLALLVIPILGFTTAAGVLAIGIGSIGTLSKLCSESVEGIDKGPIEAADAAGANALQRMRWAVIPQSAPEIAAFILYRFEINIRVSAILGVLGVGGIGAGLSDALLFKEWGLAGPRLVIVVVITILIDFVSGLVRRRILAGPKGAPARDITSDQKGELMIQGPAAYM